MSDAAAPAKPIDDPKPGAAPVSEQPAEEWKPEPRQWTWKDLFTAPMLAFKPKCMLISATTLALIGAWFWVFDEKLNVTSYPQWAQGLLSWVWNTVALTIFSLGASLVSVFLKADLLDDEFLTVGEALGQYRSRFLPALLVPLFLMGLLGGAYAALVYLPGLFCSIPYFGPFVYSLIWPLFYLFSLFVVLFGIAIWLSVFVFPSIIAIRKHGWFDNVVDTIEAVGTKPHVLAGSLALTLIMMFAAFRIGIAGIDRLKAQPQVLPEDARSALQETESRASRFGANDMMEHFDRYVVKHADSLKLREYVATFQPWDGRPSSFSIKEPNQFHHYGTGPVTGVWQCLIQGLIIGYIANLFIAGGMLTYLVVREDDYWDDEDLEDLDKLAKELEDEAKRDQAAPPAPVAPAAAPSPAPAEPPAPVAESKPPEPPAKPV